MFSHCSILSKRLYVGSSAGSIFAGPSVEPFELEDMDELPKDFLLSNASGLGLVQYVILPHHPQFEEYDQRAREKYKDQFPFVSMRDDEYRVEEPACVM